MCIYHQNKSKKQSKHIFTIRLNMRKSLNIYIYIYIYHQNKSKKQSKHIFTTRINRKNSLNIYLLPD